MDETQPLIIRIPKSCLPPREIDRIQPNCEEREDIPQNTQISSSPQTPKKRRRGRKPKNIVQPSEETESKKQRKKRAKASSEQPECEVRSENITETAKPSSSNRSRKRARDQEEQSVAADDDGDDDGNTNNSLNQQTNILKDALVHSIDTASPSSLSSDDTNPWVSVPISVLDRWTRACTSDDKEVTDAVKNLETFLSFYDGLCKPDLKTSAAKQTEARTFRALTTGLLSAHFLASSKNVCVLPDTADDDLYWEQHLAKNHRRIPGQNSDEEGKYGKPCPSCKSKDTIWLRMRQTRASDEVMEHKKYCKSCNIRFI